MSNSKHLTHDISNLVSLITKTKLGLAPRSMAPRLGAKIHGAMLPATSASRRQGHGASDHGVMPLYLGADDYGAKTRVYFLKSFRHGHI
jgi:hypothetical protein